MDFITKSRPSVVLASLGAKPPSSPTEVERPASARSFLSVWKISAPQRIASAMLSAPTGITMNSWKSMGLSARSEEHTSEFQPLMRISYAGFCLIYKNRDDSQSRHTSLHQL